jgi:uncharacterized membrane protein
MRREAAMQHSPRLEFLDGLRGIALILMVLNHTSRDWVGVSMGWGRYYLVYGTLLLPAAIFLFLVGFCLPLSWRQRAVPKLGDRLRKYGRRGAMIIGAGLLLNVLIAPDMPFWNGGVLQTIGLTIIVLGMILPVLRHGPGRTIVLALAVLLYLLFAVCFDRLVAWSAAHPVQGHIWFLGFPPFPWVAVGLAGAVFGWQWLAARERGAEQRFFAAAAAVAVVALAAYLAWQYWLSPSVNFGFKRDFILNGHWTPGAATALLVVGGVGALLAATYWLMERQGWHQAWLVVLGRTALMLYFVHQVIELTLVKNVLGWQFTSWWWYWLANVVFLVALVYMGKLWLAIKRGYGARRFRTAMT